MPLERYSLMTVPANKDISVDIVYFSNRKLAFKWFTADTTFPCYRELRDMFLGEVLNARHFNATTIKGE